MPTPSDTIYGTFGFLAKIVLTMVPQNALVLVLSILSPVPHQCRGSPPQPFSDSPQAHTVQAWFCLLAK